MADQSSDISKQEIQQQLELILHSKDFMASQRLKDFLGFIVQATLDGKGEELKAYKIAIDVFGLEEDFDPNTNPMIRTEAGRLRSKLDHYYLRNPHSEIYISIPKGAYAASFSRHPGSSANNPEVSLPPELLSLSNSASAVLTSTISLLPLVNLNKSPAAELFIEGLQNEISISLTKYSELKVIDFQRSLQLGIMDSNGKPLVPGNQARFVLTGSAQIESDVYKIWFTLGDSVNNYNIWAEKFEGKFSPADSFDIQERVAETIVFSIADDFGLIHRTLLSEYRSGKTASSVLEKASLLYYQWSSEVTFQNFAKALDSVRTALEEQPDNSLIRAMLADLYASDYQWSYGLVENGLERSYDYAISAANADPGCQIAHLALALNYFLRQDAEKFRISAQRALDINPSSGNTLAALSTWYGLLGMWDKAVELAEKIVEMNPACPGWCHATLSLYHYMRKEYSEALVEAKKVNMPYTLWDPLIRLITSIALDRKSEASEAAADLLKIYPEFEEKGAEILSRNIPNKIYISLLSEGLAKYGFAFAIKKPVGSS